MKDIPPWMPIAEAELGVKEDPDEGENPRVIEYHAATRLKATLDSVPWCSSFACWVMEQAGINHPESARARAWLRWGEKLLTPVYGCIVVFDRGHGTGHVGFFIGFDGEKLKVLGGNQSNAVNIQSWPRYKVLGFRWPKKDELSS